MSAQGATIIPFPERKREGVTWEPWITEEQIAAHYGNVSTRTIRRWRKLGMPSRLNGGSRQYRITECDAWHDARQGAPR